MERVRRVVTQIDQLLRGELTTPQAARSGRINASLGGMVLAAIACAMLYGACMGAFSLLKTPAPGLDDPWGPYKQVLASTFKTPTLLGLTLLITLPSLYVSNALVGSRLKFVSILQLLVASLAINAVVLASLGPIVLFFGVSSGSHPFMQLLNVAFFTIAGLLGLSFLLQTLHRLTAALAEQSPLVEVDENVANAESNDENLSALEMPAGDALAQTTRTVFRVWVVLFAVVGAQLGWVLRPFIGSPDLPFTLFRERESNFFAAVWRALLGLFS